MALLSPVLAALNASKVMAGLCTVLISLGGKYVASDLGRVHDIILSTTVVKGVVVFSMFFAATRDTAVSAAMTAGYIIVVLGLLHERASLCILPRAVVDQFKPEPAAEQQQHEAGDYGAYLRALEVVRKYEARATH
jgi:hypothetical protein